MFASSLTLDGVNGTDITFAQVQNLPNGIKRLDPSTTLALPRALVIQHTSSGKSPVVDRHLVQVTQTLQGASAPVTAIVNFTMAVPRDVVFTPAVVAELVSVLMDLLSNGTYGGLTDTSAVAQLMRGES